MTDLAPSQTHVGCLVARTVLGRSGKQFQFETERLLRHMGPEWVNSHYKAVWNAANHLRNGDRLAAQAVYRENSIAYHRKDMTPKGHLRPVVRGYVHASRPSVIKRYAAVLRFYTCLKLTKVSRKQKRAALDAITLPPQSKLTDEGIMSLASSHVSLSRSSVIKGLGRHFGSSYRPPEGDLYADKLRASSYYYSDRRVPKSLRGYPYASMVLSCITNSYVPQQLDDLTPCREMRDHLRNQDPFWDLKPVGKISFLQEQGCKARVVAMPNAWLQLSFSPLHGRLAYIAEEAFPQSSCVYDQMKGVYGVLRHMNEGKDIYCTDLSSATDRFPRSYSVQLLKELGMSNYADALEDVCNKQWQSPWGPVSYGTGQPMGLYGSFPLFHLSNLMIADESERLAQQDSKIELFQSGKSYYVLGDDVVFSDKSVQDRYHAQMKLLGVPISKDKSFEGKIAEFAGFMVTQSKTGYVAFRPYKSPPGSTVTNGLSFLDALGHKASRISRYWERQVARFQATTGLRYLDLSPVIKFDDPIYENIYRGDSQTAVNLAMRLDMEIDNLPDLSGSTKINKRPLFLEQGPTDFYGFSPKELMRSEADRTDLPMIAKRTISRDPTLREYREPDASSVPPDRNKRGEPVVDEHIRPLPSLTFRLNRNRLSQKGHLTPGVSSINGSAPTPPHRRKGKGEERGRSL